MEQASYRPGKEPKPFWSKLTAVVGLVGSVIAVLVGVNQLRGTPGPPTELRVADASPSAWNVRCRETLRYKATLLAKKGSGVVDYRLFVQGADYPTRKVRLEAGEPKTVEETFTFYEPGSFQAQWEILSPEYASSGWREVRGNCREAGLPPTPLESG